MKKIRKRIAKEMAMEKNKIDKIRAMDLIVFGNSMTSNGTYYAILNYDVGKLKRLSDDDLTELLFKKTLMLYPFAVIEKKATRFGPNIAQISMLLPLAPGLRTKEVPEGE